jgi:hypothetical protein
MEITITSHGHLARILGIVGAGCRCRSPILQTYGYLQARPGAAPACISVFVCRRCDLVIEAAGAELFDQYRYSTSCRPARGRRS